MLLTEKIEMAWGRNNKKYYSNLGYIYTKIGDTFELDIKDLRNGSNYEIEYQCDYCKRKFKKQYNIYLRQRNTVKKDACNNCRVLKQIDIKLYNGAKSFHDWCIENQKQDLLKRWDYKLNQCVPSNVLYSSNKNYYFKCSIDKNHRSTSVVLSSIISGRNNITKCLDCSSFYTWCLSNNHQNLLQRWDYKLNGINPKDIYKGTHDKYYLKCPLGKHNSELFSIVHIKLTTGFKCQTCNSFAEHLIRLHGDDAIQNIWYDERDPWTIDKRSRTKVCLKCEVHGKFKISCDGYFVCGGLSPLRKRA